MGWEWVVAQWNKFLAWLGRGGSDDQRKGGNATPGN
jgi:hypothetical protein